MAASRPAERWLWQPLAMALVSSGSRGNKLLFCYNGNQYSPVQDSERDLLSKLPRRTLAELLAPSSVMVRGRRFELRVDEWRFVGHPFSLQTVLWTASFNVVFVLQADCSSDVVMAYEQLSRVLGAGLVHEEHRCGYLRGQFQQLMQVGDNLDELDTTADKQSLEGIGLAATLFTVLNNLQAGDPHVHTYLNGWSEVNFRVTTCCHGDNAVCKKISDPQVKPYTALLLVKCVTEINHYLPCCCNPSLHRFLSALSPIKNLQQVSLDADIPLHQSLQFAAHLVHWGCAMSVYPLSESNVYVTSWMADTVRGSNLYTEFSSQFEDYVLPVLLEHFSTPVQLRDMTDEYPNEQLIPLVAWLLQHHQIEQLHTYIYIVKPLSRPLSRSAFSSPRPSLTPSPHSLDNSDQPLTARNSTFRTDTSTSRADTSTSRADTSTSRADTSTSQSAADTSKVDMLQYLTREEVGWVMDLANSSSEDLSLFASLCQYFHGSHHLEEVMMMENISRSQLLTLIDKFSEVLVTCSLPEHTIN